MSRLRTIRRAGALGARLIAIALLFPISVAGVWLYAIGLNRKHVQIVGQNVVGEASAYAVVQNGELILDYSRGWEGAHPKSGVVCQVPGLTLVRTIVTLTGQAKGDAILSFRVRWWLLLLTCGLSFLAAVVLALPLLRRHFSGPGRCPKCGYDLRATPERCPECGTANKPL